jgi:Tol biopolymer transport system component
VIYPVGPGQPRRINLPSYDIVTRAGLFPDGQRLWFVANEAGHGQRAYITDLSGAKPRPVTPEAHNTVLLSPDGAYFFTTTAAGEAHLYPTAGGEPLRLRLQAGERLSGCITAGPDLFVTNRSGLPAKVYRIDWRTGQREFVREIRPSDQAGVDNVDSVMITPDGKAYAYSFVQNLSELHVVEGLK